VAGDHGEYIRDGDGQIIERMMGRYGEINQRAIEHAQQNHLGKEGVFHHAFKEIGQPHEEQGRWQGQRQQVKCVIRQSKRVGGERNVHQHADQARDRVQQQEKQHLPEAFTRHVLDVAALTGVHALRGGHLLVLNKKITAIKNNQEALNDVEQQGIHERHERGERKHATSRIITPNVIQNAIFPKNSTF